jgi:hypothetical protein
LIRGKLVPGKSLDVLILFLLVLARIWSDTLADTVLPQRQADVQQLVSNWWPAASLERLAHPQTDPVSMMLIVASIGLLIVYLLLDQIETAPATSEVGNPPKPGRAGDSGATSSRAQTVHRLKLIVIYGIIALLVFGKTALLIGLRHQRGPASYTHDGGVIQTEATIDYFLAGLNPYAEDYVNTPLAEWGFSEYRTALYHYPYLPWTFIFSTPFYLLSTAWLGWFDQRLVYLVLFALSLALAQTMVRRPRDRRLAVAIIGLNPIMASDVIFGQNDSFVLFWILLGLWLVRRPGERYPALLGSAAFGLACASKPTAWRVTRPQSGPRTAAAGDPRPAGLDPASRFSSQHGPLVCLEPRSDDRRCLALGGRPGRNRLSNLGLGGQQPRLGLGLGQGSV